MIFHIAEYNWDAIEGKVKKIADKCERYGCECHVDIVGEYFKKEKRGSKTYTVKYYEIDAQGAAKCGDWECVALMTVHSGGNVIVPLSDVDVPARFYGTENVCEHCNTKRNRKHLLIVRNNETGEYKQVGTACVHDYTGINVEGILGWYEIVDTIEDDTYSDRAMRRCKKYADVVEAVCAAAYAIEVMGYRSTKYTGYCTRDAVVDIAVKEDFNRFCGEYGADCTREDVYTNERMAYARKVIEYYKNLDADGNGYIRNVQAILSDDYVVDREVGYLAYLPFGYDDAHEVASGEYVGEVGKRYKDVACESIELVNQFNGDYGMCYRYAIMVGGCELTWCTSKLLDIECVHTITYTVKAHSEYKHRRQTIVTRCVVK